MTRSLTKTNVPGIFRRGSRHVVVLRDARGKQFKRSARTMAEARSTKATLTTDMLRGDFRFAEHKITFAQYAEEWMRTYAGRTGRGIREVTLDKYRRDIRSDAIPFFGKMQLADVEVRDIKAFALHVADRGVSNNTVRLKIAAIRALFATAREEGLIRHNPVSGFRNVYGVRSQDDLRSKALSDEQLRRLIEAANPEHRFLLTFLAQTGLRIAEAVAVQWQDIDFDAQRLSIVRRYWNGTVDTPKSKFGLRVIPLTVEVANYLSNLQAERQAVQLATPEDHIFCSQVGTPMDPNNVRNRILKPAASSAGLSWVTLHTLRHTCASRLFRGGWNAKQVQMVLGHHSPAFTLATYVHLMPDDLPSPECLSLASITQSPRP